MRFNGTEPLKTERFNGILAQETRDLMGFSCKNDGLNDI
jgi:hypothetical protein